MSELKAKKDADEINMLIKYTNNLTTISKNDETDALQ